MLALDDVEGRLAAGVVAGGGGGADQSVSITYGGDGGSVWTYHDGTQVTRNAGGGVVREALPDGWRFTSFDGQGRPTAGMVPGGGGGGDQSVSITYGGDGG